MKHTAKTLKRILKKAGLKCSGKKATLRARAKKAKLIRGGNSTVDTPVFAGVGEYPNNGGVGTGAAPQGSNSRSGGRRRRRGAKGCRKHSSSSSESSSDSD